LLPFQTRRWVDSICNDWDFNKVIPCHFNAPIPARPADVKRAFAFAYEQTEQLKENEQREQQGGSGPLSWLTSLFRRRMPKVRTDCPAEP